MELIIGWLVFAVVVGICASSRGRSGFGWFLLSVAISPILALILVLVMPKLGAAEAARDAGGEVVDASTHVRCPDCRELVRRDARKCKHCGAALIPQ